MRVLIVDDNTTNIALLEQVLERAGYTEKLSTTEPSTVVHLCEAWNPDVLLLDLHMPGQSGYEVMEAIRERIVEPESLPVLVLTADVSPEARHRALSMGARDYIGKPIDSVELLLRVRNVLQTRMLQKELQRQNAILEAAVRARTAELEQARLESLAILASVAEFHDDTTHQHTQRVGLAAAMIAQAMGLPDKLVSQIRDAAPLHDIGKVAISRHILLKPGGLTAAERLNMMRHVEIGDQILAAAQSPVLTLAREIARTHHERWDGRGYLTGLAGDQIPIAGRIAAVADVFDALTHDRPYKAAWDIDRAQHEIICQSGTQFDPRVIAAFQTLDPTIVAHQQPGEPASRAA